jgi:hypothetical protein
MGRADLHIHSSYSFDSTTSIEVVLEQAAYHCRLDVIAITDHDEIEGALRTAELASRYSIHLIPGIEISTSEGHLLALWVQRLIPAGLPLLETLAQIGDQGGLAIAAHPMAPGVHSLSADAIRRAAAHPGLGNVLVGIEVINAGLVFKRVNLSAGRLCQEMRLASVGNSDAHVSWMIGTGLTDFPGHSAEHLRTALLERRTSAWYRARPEPVRFLVSNSYHMLLRKMGYVLCSDSSGGRRRLQRLEVAHAYNRVGMG